MAVVTGTGTTISWHGNANSTTSASMLRPTHLLSAGGSAAITYAIKWIEVTSSRSPGWAEWIPGEGWSATGYPARSPAERLREIIAGRVAPRIMANEARRAVWLSPDVREARARQTLQRIIGPEKYRSFLRCGFVTLRAKDGLTYQVRPGHEMTTVYDREKCLTKLCIVFDGNFTPVDSLIMRCLLILNDPKEFWTRANKWSPQPRRLTMPSPTGEVRNLADILRELKSAGRQLAA
jgi:hypothetical protein